MCAVVIVDSACSCQVGMRVLIGVNSEDSEASYIVSSEAS